MSNIATLEVPPPGPGFDTVTKAVAAAAKLEAGTGAVSCELLTKVVTSAPPFQFTTEPFTKFVPFTVSLKPGLPGTAAAGRKGRFTKGTGLLCPNVRAAEPSNSKLTTTSKNERNVSLNVVSPQESLQLTRFVP
jgi:hypothetical protein